jgi:hypothetical protein
MNPSAYVHILTNNPLNTYNPYHSCMKGVM